LNQFDEHSYDKPFDIKIFKFLIPFFKPYLKLIVLMLLIAVVTSGIDMAIPLFLRHAINQFITRQSLGGLLPYCGLYFFTVAMQVVGTLAFIRMSMAIDVGLSRDLRRAQFVHLQHLSFSYYNTTPVGYILSRVMSDTGRISDIFSWGVMDSLWSLAYTTGVLLIMLRLNRQLAGLILLIIPLAAVITVLFRRRLLAAHREIRRANSQITRSYNESIGGARTSKVLVIENQNHAEFQHLTQTYRRAGIRAGRLNAVFMPLVAFCGALTSAIVLTRGGQMTMEQALELGTFAAFLSYATSIFDPIQNLARFFTEIIAVQANVERVSDLLHREPDITDSPEVIERYGDSFQPKKENWEVLRGEIKFRDVSFRYPDGDEEILEHFSLKVPQGTNVAIVGETGAGKSTIVNLACRFFEPTEGQILIDGLDYRERSQLWLHSNIGYVLQNPHLFTGSIRENIRYGKLEAGDAEVEEAARLVSADKVASRLEQGYDTEVGEGGDLLSTGEKQLISYARAILADPPIFVLDEATCSIDTETEQWIQEATATLLRGRTAFLIAHRLSTIQMADIILVVKEGKIIERGTHKELMKARGHYYNLYTKQFEEDSWARQGAEPA